MDMPASLMPRIRAMDKDVLVVDATPEELERGRRFAAWLTEARRRKGWNKKELHEASGVSNTYIGVLENDGINNTTGSYQRPSEAIIEKLATALGADISSGLIAAGYTPKKHWRKIEYTLDPDVDVIVEAYSGASPQNKRLLRRIAEEMRQMEKEHSIGGRRADEDDAPTVTDEDDMDATE